MRPCRALFASFLLLVSFDSANAQTDAPLRPTPPAFVPPLLTEPQVKQAVDRLDDIVEAAMANTGVPGVAVAVVYGDEVLYARGFGVREAGQPEPVDTDTVFQLASVSKPIASTIVAAVVGQGQIAWDHPVRKYTPGFDLSDPYVTANVTLADLLSHRSGLYTSAGDLLEDLGYDRSYILARLDQQPLDAFRSSYNYNNFGFTAGAEAAAAAAGSSWEELANKALFVPLGMTRTSYRHADFLARENRARLHVRNASGEWSAKNDRRPDPQAPAGGASGSIADVARFLRLHLASGRFQGRQVVEPDALAVTYAPHAMPALPRTPLSRAGFYGLGWNVGYDDRGRLEIGHAGAFYLGASTYVGLIPGEQLGIAVVTNGEPIGVPEGIARAFFDIANNGRQTVDWLALFARVFAGMRAAEAAPFDYGKPPADARSPGVLSDYVGRYDSPYYGPLVVADRNGRLSMELGPRPGTWELSHHDGDTFTFKPIGENAVPRAGITFERRSDGFVSGLVIDFYDQTGLGTFLRDQPE
jgi:CubicO group peptidase (beta-lactamase class C family)